MNDYWDQLFSSFRYYLKVERSLSENTIEAYIADLERFVDFLQEYCPEKKIEQIDNSVLNEFADRLQKKDSENLSEEESLLQSASRLRIIQGVRAFFKYLLLAEIIERNPAENIVTPYLEKKLPEILERSEIEKMMDSIDVSTRPGYRNRLSIEVLYSTGMRVSEFVNLKLSEINYEQEYLDIIGKGDKERLIPIDSQVLKDLRFYIEHYRRTQRKKPSYKDYVFLSEKRGEKLTRQFVFKMLRETAAIAGIEKKVHPHILRHSFATQMIRGGASLVAVKQILGHVSVRSTEIYINLDTSDLRRTLQSCHPFFKQD